MRFQALRLFTNSRDGGTVSMFEYIRGRLVRKTSAEAVVEAERNRIRVYHSGFDYDKLPALDAEVNLLCHHYVREDAEKLYGFLSDVERDIFRQLINSAISDQRPRSAFLSGITPSELISCVNKGKILPASQGCRVWATRPHSGLSWNLKASWRRCPIRPGMMAPAVLIRQTCIPKTGRKAYAAMVSLGIPKSRWRPAFFSRGKRESALMRRSRMDQGKRCKLYKPGLQLTVIWKKTTAYTTIES